MKLKCSIFRNMNEVDSAISAVLVEDDYLTRDSCMTELREMGIQVEGLGTEYKFRQNLAMWEETPPDIFVFGTWVRWTDPSPDMPEPTQDVIDEGYHRKAGLRMQRYIAVDPVLQHVPVILWGFKTDDGQFIGKQVLSKKPPLTVFVDKYDEITRPGILARTIRSLAIANR